MWQLGLLGCIRYIYIYLSTWLTHSVFLYLIQTILNIEIERERERESRERERYIYIYIYIYIYSVIYSNVIDLIVGVGQI